MIDFQWMRSYITTNFRFPWQIIIHENVDHLNCRSHGWRIDTDEQDAHEMLHVLLTSLEEEAQTSSETVASKTASLAFYDDIIGRVGLIQLNWSLDSWQLVLSGLTTPMQNPWLESWNPSVSHTTLEITHISHQLESTMMTRESFHWLISANLYDRWWSRRWGWWKRCRGRGRRCQESNVTITASCDDSRGLVSM